MNLNVLKNFPYSTYYYIRHPWKWIEHLCNNIKMAYQRIKYGYCYTDVYNIDHYLLEILPRMLRELALEDSHPCSFQTIEEWHNWLESMADVFESLPIDNWKTKNEFADDFYSLCDKCRYIEKDEKGFTHVKWVETEELKDLKNLYFERNKELKEEREILLQDTFKLLGQHLDELWS